MKCEYCITAQAMLGKSAGATDDEIKAAANCCGSLAIFGFAYGNEFVG